MGYEKYYAAEHAALQNETRPKLTSKVDPPALGPGWPPAVKPKGEPKKPAGTPKTISITQAPRRW